MYRYGFDSEEDLAFFKSMKEKMEKGEFQTNFSKQRRSPYGGRKHSHWMEGQDKSHYFKNEKGEMDYSKLLEGGHDVLSDFAGDVQGLRDYNLDKTRLESWNVTSPDLIGEGGALHRQARAIEDSRKLKDILEKRWVYKQDQKEKFEKRKEARVERAAIRKRIREAGLEHDKLAGQSFDIKKAKKSEREKLP